MTAQARQLPLPGFETARAEWRADYDARLGGRPNPRNRSGIEVKGLALADVNGDGYLSPTLTDCSNRGIRVSSHNAWPNRKGEFALAATIGAEAAAPILAAEAMATLCTSTRNSQAPARQNRPWIAIQMNAPATNIGASASPSTDARAPMPATNT